MNLPLGAPSKNGLGLIYPFTSPCVFCLISVTKDCVLYLLDITSKHGMKKKEPYLRKILTEFYNGSCLLIPTDK